MIRTLVDSNILAYAALKDQGEKHKEAVDAIANLILERRMVVSIQNLVELSSVLLEKAKPAPELGNFKRTIFGYSKCAEVLRYSDFTIINAASIKKEHKIHFYDSLLIATMQENNISNILTENTKDFKGISWIKATNPFTQ